MTAPLPAMAAEARSVRLESEIDRRGIKLSAGTERCGPCPKCGGKDRFWINVKKQVWLCRKCETGGDVIALVRHLDGLSFGEAVRLLAGHAPPQKPAAGSQGEPAGHMNRAEPKKAAGKLPGDDEPKRKAAWLWSIREPISESNAAGLYLRKRSYEGQFPASLGYLPSHGKHPPATIAAFGFCDEPEPGLITPPEIVTAVHLTRLTPQGGKAPIDPVKIMLGPSMGLPIVLAPANDLLAIDITEGIETGLAVFDLRGAGVWVAGAAGRMPALMGTVPAYTECLNIFAERDEAGLRFAREAARIAAARGIETHIKAFEAR
jgi:hypothetical protein